LRRGLGTDFPVAGGKSRRGGECIAGQGAGGLVGGGKQKVFEKTWFRLGRPEREGVWGGKRDHERKKIVCEEKGKFGLSEAGRAGRQFDVVAEKAVKGARRVEKRT